MSTPEQLRPMTVDTFRGADGKFYWRLVGGNGEKFAASQGYKREFAARRAAQRLIDAGRQGIVWKNGTTQAVRAKA